MVFCMHHLHLLVPLGLCDHIDEDDGLSWKCCWFEQEKWKSCKCQRWNNNFFGLFMWFCHFCHKFLVHMHLKCKTIYVKFFFVFLKFQKCWILMHRFHNTLSCWKNICWWGFTQRVSCFWILSMDFFPVRKKKRWHMNALKYWRSLRTAPYYSFKWHNCTPLTAPNNCCLINNVSTGHPWTEGGPRWGDNVGRVDIIL